MSWLPRYSYSDHLVRELGAIDYARAVVDVLPLPPDQSLRLRHAAYQNSTRASTAIEGNTLDAEAVRRAIANGERTGIKAEQEVRNYWRALDLVDEWAAGNRALNEAVIQEWHAVVIVRGIGRRRARSPYRETELPVVDTTTRLIEYMPPEPGDVKSLMADFCRWLESRQFQQIHPVVAAALASHRFITIHPFEDGNGRTGRLLATAILWRSGYSFRRFLSFEEFFAGDRDSYYRHLQLGLPANYYEGRHDPDHDPWIAYFTATVGRATAELGRKAQQLQARRLQPPAPWESLDRRQQQLLTRLLSRAQAGLPTPAEFTVADLEEWFGVSDRTAREWLDSWRQEAFVEPARAGQRIRRHRLCDPWSALLAEPLSEA